jgi:hypothetical protein
VATAALRCQQQQQQQQHAVAMLSKHLAAEYHSGSCKRIKWLALNVAVADGKTSERSLTLIKSDFRDRYELTEVLPATGTATHRAISMARRLRMEPICPRDEEMTHVIATGIQMYFVDRHVCFHHIQECISEM